MPTCSQCGSQLDAVGEACPACGLRSVVAERRAELKVDPHKLDEAPTHDQAPTPGDWGRADDAAGTTQPLAEVRQLRPAPDGEPTTGRSSSSEAGTDRSADVVYLHGAEHAQPGAPEPRAEGESSGAGNEEPAAPKAEPVAASPESHPEVERASVAVAPPAVVTPPAAEGPPPQDPDTAPDKPAEPLRTRERVPPPMLASDALRHELTPSEPHGLLSRVVAVLAALAGGAAVITLVGTGGIAPVLLGAFAALAVMGVAPMPYGVRATALSVIASGGLSATLWARAVRGGERDEALLAAVVVVCAAALFFRSWHRGSTLARALVAVGIILGMGWLSSRGDLSDLAGLGLAWQSWSPRVLQLTLAVLLLLSLLAFMDARTTGACSVWALGLLLWYGADAGLKWLAQLWPVTEALPQLSMMPAVMSLAYVTAPLLAAVLSVSMAQLFAAAHGVAPRPRS